MAMLRRLSAALSALSLLAVTACATSGTGPATSPSVTASAVTVSERSPDFTCLREAIYYEAGLSQEGRLAVANVIMNRARDGRFPATICGVIADGQSRGACQFSYRCDSRPETFGDEVKFRLATEAARLALGRQVPDPTNGALFFHAASIPPGWFGTLDRRGNFGGNIFYR
jgi:spore germination cell wall hydrolase CwlJ-like protein